VPATKITDPGGSNGAILLRSGGSWAQLAIGSTGQQLQVRSDGTLKHTSQKSVPVFVFGAVADAVNATDGAMTSGSTTLTVSGVTSAHIGMSIVVHGAGASGAPLKTTIAPGTTTGSAVLSASASTTVSGTEVTWGTDNSAAFQAGSNANVMVDVPDGNYLVLSGIAPDSTPRALRYSGSGKGRTTIYFPGDVDSLARCAANYATAINVTSNVAVGDSTLQLTSTTTLRKGDVLRLRSEGAWDSTLTDTSVTPKKGEWVRIASVDSSTQVTLASPTDDSYLTADTARVDKMTFNRGSLVENITFHNCTPDYSSTRGGVLDIRQSQGALIRNCTFEQGVGAQVLFYEAIDSEVQNCKFVDGYAVSASAGIALGYGVLFNSNSFNCWVRDSIVLRGHGVCTTSAGTSNYGVPRHCGAIKCTAIWPYNQPFHTHEQGRYIKFINCTVQGGAGTTAGGFVDGVGCYAKDMLVDGMVIENLPHNAINVQHHGERCTIRNVFIRNCAGGIDINEKDCRVENPDIANIVAAAAPGDVHAGYGVRIRDVTGAIIKGGVISDVAGAGIVNGDSTDSAIGSDVLLRNTGGYGLYHEQNPVSAKWQNMRSVNTASGLTNKLDSIVGMRNAFIAPTGPGFPVNASSAAVAANKMYWDRWEAPCDMNIASIAFPLDVASGSDDTCAVAILDASGNRLAKSADNVAGKLNTGAGAWVSVPLTANYMVRQGQVYYLAIAFGGTVGAALRLRQPNLPDFMAANLGTGAGQRDQAVTSGVTSAIGAGPHTPTTSVVPFLKAVPA
jgi:hypothetical protein